MSTNNERAKYFQRSREKLVAQGKEKYREVLRKQGVPGKEVDKKLGGNAWSAGIQYKGL